MITEFPLDLTSILNEKFVGKTYRYCTRCVPIYDYHTVILKKPGTTRKQYHDNPQKYAIKRISERNIGSYATFEESIIKRIWIHHDYEYGDKIKAELENGETVNLDVI